jgi:hypothetical protein
MCKIHAECTCPATPIVKPHKHAATIKAWADGAIIEKEGEPGKWVACPTPHWNVETVYRIKPEPLPLSVVARTAWYTMHIPGIGTNRDGWKEVADAVVAAYKERQ